MRFGHLCQRLFNTPLAIRPEKAEVIMAALAERLGVSKIMRMDGTEVLAQPLAFSGDGRLRDQGAHARQGMTW